jgi:hypothetical protein
MPSAPNTAVEAPTAACPAGWSAAFRPLPRTPAARIASQPKAPAEGPGDQQPEGGARRQVPEQVAEVGVQAERGGRPPPLPAAHQPRPRGAERGPVQRPEVPVVGDEQEHQDGAVRQRRVGPAARGRGRGARPRPGAVLALEQRDLPPGAPGVGRVDQEADAPAVEGQPAADAGGGQHQRVPLRAGRRAEPADLDGPAHPTVPARVPP